MASIGDRLRRLREGAGLSKFDLSLITRIPEPNLRNWELGRRISKPEDIAALADALGVTTDYLIIGAGPVVEAEQLSTKGASDQ